MNTETSPQLGFLQEYEYEKTHVLAGISPLGEMIAIRPVCENLGIDRKWQQDKIKSDPYLSSVGGMVKVRANDGKKYEMYCLPPLAFQHWLWNLTASDNIRVDVWEQYKKGLVLHLVLMLKVSLEEVKRLRQVEADYEELLEDTNNYFLHDEKLSEYHSAGQLCRKEKARFKDQILSKLRRNPNQTVIEFKS